jgi:putative endonuclease
MPTYYVYILTNQSRTLYVGMTDNLKNRLREHRAKKFDGFTARYNVNRIVYFETSPYLNMALAREKQLKGWSRAKKIALVDSVNPRWDNLSDAWGIADGPGDFTVHLRLRPDPSTPDASHPPLRIKT